MPNLQLNFSYHVVMSFTAKRKSDGLAIRFLPGESVYLKREDGGMVEFESGGQAYDCSYMNFRLGTMKLLRG